MNSVCSAKGKNGAGQLDIGNFDDQADFVRVGLSDCAQVRTLIPHPHKTFMALLTMTGEVFVWGTGCLTGVNTTMHPQLPAEMRQSYQPSTMPRQVQFPPSHRQTHTNSLHSTPDPIVQIVTGAGILIARSRDGVLWRHELERNPIYTFTSPIPNVDRMYAYLIKLPVHERIKQLELSPNSRSLEDPALHQAQFISLYYLTHHGEVVGLTLFPVMLNLLHQRLISIR